VTRLLWLNVRLLVSSWREARPRGPLETAEFLLSFALGWCDGYRTGRGPVEPKISRKV
jgi:hypothetical protein